jgi:hypothetical protein
MAARGTMQRTSGLFNPALKRCLTGTRGLSVVVRVVQVFAWGKIIVTAEVIGAEWFRDFVFFAEPFAEIDQFAPFRTEWTILGFEPFALFFAGWAADRALHSFNLWIAREMQIYLSADFKQG